MKKTSHLIWTFSLSLWFFYFLFHFKLIELLIFSSITSFFSSLPDIDIKIVNHFKDLNKKTFFITFPIYLFVKILFKHRTITHTIYFAGIFYFLYLIFSKFYFLSMFFLILSIAIIFHILEDSFTISGVQPIYPIKFKLRLFKFSTESNFHEILLNILGLIIGCLYFYFIY